MNANECKCIECGKQAVAFFPVCDPDIPAFPYCRECLDKVKMDLLIQLKDIDKKYKKGGEE